MKGSIDALNRVAGDIHIQVAWESSDVGSSQFCIQCKQDDRIGTKTAIGGTLIGAKHEDVGLSSGLFEQSGGGREYRYRAKRSGRDNHPMISPPGAAPPAGVGSMRYVLNLRGGDVGDYISWSRRDRLEWRDRSSCVRWCPYDQWSCGLAGNGSPF